MPVKEYFKFCEEDLFQDWLVSSSKFDCFKKDFQIGHIPEPYYILEEGKNPLYVLNYNPGAGLVLQLRENVLSRPHKTYREASSFLADYYKNELEGNAPKRNQKILEFMKAMGYDGAICLETFFMHSAKWNKGQFLKKYKSLLLADEYFKSLKAFLEGKPVLRISASSSSKKAKLDDYSTFKTSWTEHQDDLMGMSIEKMDPVFVSERNGRHTSAVYACSSPEKFISFKMGSNDLPVLEQEHYDALKKICNI